MKLFSMLNPQYHRFFDVRIARDIGINGALLLQELVYKHDYWEEQGKLELDGSFFVTQEDVERDTTLSPHQQSYALKTLVDKGLVKVSKHGMPSVNYYLLDEKALMQYLVSSDANFSQQSFTSDANFSQQSFTGESTVIQNLVNSDANFKITNISDTKIINTKEDTIPKGIVAVSGSTSKKTSQEERYKKALETDTKDIGAIFYYIDHLQKSKEFIEALKKWYNAVGKGFHLEQLKMRLDDLYKLFTEEKDQIDRINLCYKGNYPTFVFKTDKPETKSTPSWIYNPDTKEKDKDLEARMASMGIKKKDNTKI